MSVILATLEHLPAIRALLKASPRRLLQLGEEDWPARLASASVYVGLDGEGLWGVLAVYAEPRPRSLPPAAPARVYLRGLGFRRGVSPSAGLTALVQAFGADGAALPRLLIAYGGEPWLTRAYGAAGLELYERVVYFQRPRLGRMAAALAPPAGPATLAWATPGDIGTLADLDGSTFAPVWHLSAPELRGLLLQGSIQMARVDGTLAGYMAYTMQGESALLARLAVHPTWQGRGIGRQLLAHCLVNAAAQGCQRALLNTQATNSAAQGLYRAFGFEPTGEQLGVYTLIINN